MKLHITVMAHADRLSLEGFRRHLPLWQAMKPTRAMVLCPDNSMISESDSPWPIVGMCPSEHHGPTSLRRIRTMLDYLSREEAEQYAIFEYDSFSLSPAFPPQSGFVGNVFFDGGVHFMSHTYATVPWILDRKTLVTLSETAVAHPEIHEDGYYDRYMGAIAKVGNVPLVQHRPLGFSCNTVNVDLIREMRQRIFSGGTMIHGVKDKWTFEAALQFYRESPYHDHGAY